MGSSRCCGSWPSRRAWPCRTGRRGKGLDRYVTGASLKGEAAIDWNDRAARTRFLAEIVADADRLLEVVRATRTQLVPDSPEDHALEAAAGVLSRILVAGYRAGG